MFRFPPTLRQHLRERGRTRRHTINRLDKLGWLLAASALAISFAIDYVDEKRGLYALTRYLDRAKISFPKGKLMVAKILLRRSDRYGIHGNIKAIVSIRVCRWAEGLFRNPRHWHRSQDVVGRCTALCAVDRAH